MLTTGFIQEMLRFRNLNFIRNNVEGQTACLGHMMSIRSEIKSKIVHFNVELWKSTNLNVQNLNCDHAQYTF